MFVEVAVLTISVLNIIVVSTLLFVFMKYFKANNNSTTVSDDRAERYYDDLMERIKRIEKENPSKVLAKFENQDLNIINAGTNRIKSAVKRLREGSPPDKVRKEFGYSRSEIGIIKASAGLKSELNDIRPL